MRSARRAGPVGAGQPGAQAGRRIDKWTVTSCDVSLPPVSLISCPVLGTAAICTGGAPPANDVWRLDLLVEGLAQLCRDQPATQSRRSTAWDGS